MREDYNSQSDQLVRPVQGSTLDRDPLDPGAGSSSGMLGNSVLTKHMYRIGPISISWIWPVDL